MIADALDTCHLLVVEGSRVQSLEVVLHLRCGGGSSNTDVHVGIGENEAVAVRGSKRRLARGHVFCLERFAPARGGEDHDARPVLLGQVGEDVLLRNAYYP